MNRKSILILLLGSSLLLAEPVDKTLVAISFIISILVMKITAFILGYLIVKLGHDTLIKGISGEIDFGFKGGGISTKLKSGSPGAFFILAGAAIIMWAMFVEKTYEVGNEKTPVAVEEVMNKGDDSALEKPDKPTLKF